MPKESESNVLDILLEAHRKGVEAAIDLSIRTGVPLVVQKGGKIVEIKPKYKYVLAPIESKKAKRRKKPKA